MELMMTLCVMGGARSSSVPYQETGRRTVRPFRIAAHGDAGGLAASAFALFLLAATPVFAGDVAPVEVPFYVYSDFGARGNHGSPSGWMGDYRDLRINMDHRTNVFAGTSCMSFTYTASGSRYSEMAGMVWQNPANNSGDFDGGMNLSSAKKLTFWARGEKGREYIDEFTVGGSLGAYPDTDKGLLQDTMLGPDWQLYEIDLSKCDMSYISSFFGWVASRYHNRDGFTIYIDEVKFE